MSGDAHYQRQQALHKSIRETLETIAGESFIRTERERLELWLMFMYGRRNLFLAPDPEQ